jgi:hypothetical protein
LEASGPAGLVLYRQEISNGIVFKKAKKVAADPIASLESQLTEARAKHRNIDERLRVAQGGAVERRATAETLAAAGGSDEELNGVETQLRAFEDRGRSFALSTVDSDIAQLERGLATAKQAKQAKQVADAIEALVGQLIPLAQSDGFVPCRS